MSEIIIVQSISVKNVIKTIYPIDLSMFLYKKNKCNYEPLLKQRKVINNFILNMTHLLNVVEEVYGPQYSFTRTRQLNNKFICDFQSLIKNCPKKFIKEEIYEPIFTTGYKDIKIHYISIKPELIAYLKKANYVQIKIIKVFEKQLEYKEEDIEDWSKRLLEERNMIVVK